MRTMFMRYPQGKAKALTLSYDDGVPQDERLVKIFNQHGIKATFNLNCGCIDKTSMKAWICRNYLSSGHEIAVHGFMHRANGNIRAIEGIRDVLDCNRPFSDFC